MCYEVNGNRHLGSLHILYQKEPTTNDGKFVQVRQWLTAEGEHADLIIEHGQLEGEELQTEVEVVPFFLDTEQVLDIVNCRKGK